MKMLKKNKSFLMRIDIRKKNKAKFVQKKPRKFYKDKYHTKLS